MEKKDLKDLPVTLARTPNTANVLSASPNVMSPSTIPAADTDARNTASINVCNKALLNSPAIMPLLYMRSEIYCVGLIGVSCTKRWIVRVFTLLRSLLRNLVHLASVRSELILLPFWLPMICNASHHAMQCYNT